MRRFALLGCLAACTSSSCGNGAGSGGPKLTPIADQVVAVGGELRLILEAAAPSPAGGDIRYGFASDLPGAGDRAELNRRPDGTGVFTLRPLGPDVGTWHFDFTAEMDGQSDTLTVAIEVRSAVSRDPHGHAEPISGADEAFDVVFGPFRPDLGGAPVASGDFGGGGIPELRGGEDCLSPAGRQARAACAVWALGSLIGTTMTHEIGHSLGLANPDSPTDPHDFGDAPDRITDAGGARPFRERAELDGLGPARFCDGEYRYVREVLPSEERADDAPRPGCE